jgi:tRNA dimethylallyltransferase
MNTKIPVIFGPTASGKSGLALALAEKINGEIISADSRQIYRGLDIGTCKVLPSQTGGIPQHLIDIKTPDQDFSAAEFVESAEKLIIKIQEGNKWPVIAGGTGLYIKALVEGLHEFPCKDPEIRERWGKMAREHGTEKLHKYLTSVDPGSGAEIHPNNLQRLVRAIELFEITGITREELKNQSRKMERGNNEFVLFFLVEPRDTLYEKINIRVDQMVRNGLFEEAGKLFREWGRDCKALNTIGYSEIISEFFENNEPEDRVVEMIKQNTRKYAKRQITWMRHAFNIQSIEIDNVKPISYKLQVMEKYINYRD